MTNPFVPELRRQLLEGAHRFRRRRRRRAIVVSVLLVLAVPLGASALIQRGGSDLDIATDTTPTSPPTRATEPTSTTEPPSTIESSSTTTPVPPTSPPATLAALREDGWLVLIDSATGEELLELAFHGDPRGEPDPEGHYRSFIESATVSPDGRTVYYTTCCEPAHGTVYSLPVEGGEPQVMGDGQVSGVSPDGTTLAVVVLPLGVNLIDSDGSLVHLVETTGDFAFTAETATWTPDGASLIVEAGERLVMVPPTASNVASGREISPPPEHEWSSPVARPDGSLVVVDGTPSGTVLREVGADGTPGDQIDLGGRTPAKLSSDSSGGWLLVVTTANEVLMLAPDNSVQTIATGLAHADW